MFFITLALLKNTFSREDFFFNGWAGAPSADPVYGDEFLYDINDTSPRTLYAVWVDKNVFSHTGSADEDEAENVYITDYTGYDNVLFIPSVIGNKHFVGIDMGAFQECPSLISVYIPDSIKTLDDYAFFNCESLTSVVIPDSITSIGNYTFYGCIELASVSMPDTITSIGNETFYKCYKLSSITLPESLTSIGDSAFEGCTTLVSIEIPDSLTTISFEAFYTCYALTSVTIPESVTIISANAFKSCTTLPSITIPSSVTSIGGSAFNDCLSLKSVTVLRTTTPTLSSNAFSSTHTDLKIYVPSGSVAAYKAAAGWSAYESRIEAIP